jgi:hypothetical protein
MSVSVNPPYPIFSEADGLPLENGYIWIGAANLDPQTNPINVYWDAALTITAAQPIRTLNGYAVYQGTPSRFYVNTNYSIRVLNKNGSTVYTSLNENAIGSSSIISNATGDGVQLIFNLSFSPVNIYINGVYQNKNTYTTLGNTVTFTQAPPITSIIEFVF